MGFADPRKPLSRRVFGPVAGIVKGVKNKARIMGVKHEPMMMGIKNL